MMTSFLIPPHEVVDEEYYDNMIGTLEDGGELPPVVVLDCGNEYAAITGSHRIAAWSALELEPNFLVVDDDEYAAAANSLWPGDDPRHPQEIGDYGVFCYALYKLTADIKIKEALKDQIQGE